jgi:outer membrane receptor protein involved in Fe transport
MRSRCTQIALCAYWIASLVVFAWTSVFALAQTSALLQAKLGSLKIAVSDPSGAPVEATGTLRRPDGSTAPFQTDARGAVTLFELPYGSYRVDVEKAGFAPQSFSIDVHSVEPMVRTVKLALRAAEYKVEVIAATPLSGVDLQRGQIASPVQTVTARDIENSGALDLSDLLNRRLNGVYLNEMQGNPVQPDLNYRGYTASPLLGTPQGLSIYMDGVRLNQPFGDVVAWDLIPRIAIGETTLMPGSNPLFGLNALGGALAIETKSGQDHPGTQLDLSGGSFGRKMASLEHGGGDHRGWNWYGATSFLFEDGWRQSSPSDVRQFFGKLGWTGSKTTFGLTLAYANNSLNGNGLQDPRLLASKYSSVYSKPDITANRSPFVNLKVRHGLTPDISISANAYYRYILTKTMNGDVNGDSLDQAVYQPSAADQAALTAAGYTGFPKSGANAANTPFPFWRCIAQALQRDEPGEKCNGLITRTRSAQSNFGAAGQLSWLENHGANRNQFTVGAAWDGSNIDYAQNAQLGYLNPDRSVTGVNAFEDGILAGNINGVPLDTRVDLHGRVQTGSVYLTDTFSLGRRWNFTLSGRYNSTTVRNRDRIQPVAGSGSLTGDYVFGRLNPAAGITYNAGRGVNAYFSYSEGSRAPTSVELGCADPSQPCKLPNAMQSDPPLKQVVARTFEAGVRSAAESKLTWSGGYFRGENHDDILFVAAPQNGFGYFKNFGMTLRQGVEADFSRLIGRVTLGGGYTFLNATFQTPELLNASSNSSNVDGITPIQPGDRVPLTPQNMFKAYTDAQVTKKLAMDVSVLGVTQSYARGNENNLDRPDGVYYIGSGTIPGYAVVNLGARFQMNRRWQFFAQVNNLFDRHYYTAAQLGSTGFTSTGTFIARPFPAVAGSYPLQRTAFLAPGAPLGAWVGVRIRF